MSAEDYILRGGECRPREFKSLLLSSAVFADATMLNMNEQLLARETRRANRWEIIQRVERYLNFQSVVVRCSRALWK